MRPVSGVVIGLRFLNLTVRKTCSNLPFFPRTARDWNQPHPDMPDIKSLAKELINYGITLVHWLNDN